MKMKKNIIIMLLLLCSFGVASAQSTLKTAYFMDRMTTRHTINPALMNEYGYFSLPALGSVDFGINSNLSIDKFLFPLESGQLGTFAHPDVDSAEFLSGLSDDNVISQDFNISLLSTGFHAFGGYNTFGVAVRENMDINLKKSLFEFLVGAEDKSSYDMAGSSIDLLTWTEVAFGHARRINDNLTVGVKLKYLIGMANASVEFDQMSFSSSAEELMLNVNAVGNAALMGVQLDGLASDIFDDIDFGGNMNTGFGIDLGATYEMDKFNFSVALTDLGFIQWSAPSTIEMGTDINFSGFTDLDIDDFEGSTESQFDDLESSLDSLGDPTFVPTGTYNTGLYAKLNVAAEYTVVEDLFSAGLLSSTTFGPVTTTELMAVGTFSPVKWFDLALSGTVSTYGSYWGCAVNFCPRWINFFVGVDSMFTGITPQGIPYSSSNFSVSMGLSFPFGSLHKAN